MVNSKLFFLAFSFIVQHVLTANGIGEHRMVPTLYVFGSSAVDSANKNHLNTIAKANLWPYGIDFNNVMGRYSNGKNWADFVSKFDSLVKAINLGLPMAPLYLNLSEYERGQITKGINYGSGACGILNTSRVGECLTLVQQAKHFTLTAIKELPKALKNQKKLQQHLAKSIYLLFIGINGYNKFANGNILDKFSPQDFVDYLLDEITKHIKTLYDLGARKFVVYGISKCGPFQYTQGCESRYYIDKLPQRLQKLQAELPCLLFTIYDVFSTYKNILENHKKYGISNIKDPCYLQGKPLCPDRSKYHLFDMWGHQTEVSCQIAAKDYFNGTACSPYTLSELAKAPIHC